MNIAFIGSRGIPARHGGFETFVEEVAAGLNKNKDINIIVVCDKYQKAEYSEEVYNGIKLIYSKYSKSENPNMYYWDSIKRVLNEVDVIYSCGLGASFLFWIPRLKGVKFVANPDGLGWKRDKWSLPVKAASYFLYWASSITSEFCLCDSKGVKKEMEKEFNRKQNSHVIEYGAYKNVFLFKQNQIENHLSSFQIEKNKYHLIVARIEPENNLNMMLEGYQKAKCRYPLIIVGNLQDTSYVKHIVSRYKSNKIRFIGGIYDKTELQAIRAGSLTYLHGHSVGGTNPSLLEAMASKNLCICHDNIFNREVTDNRCFYFKNAEELTHWIKLVEDNPDSDHLESVREDGLKRISDYYNWPNIVKRYYKYFKSL